MVSPLHRRRAKARASTLFYLSLACSKALVSRVPGVLFLTSRHLPKVPRGLAAPPSSKNKSLLLGHTRAPSAPVFDSPAESARKDACHRGKTVDVGGPEVEDGVKRCVGVSRSHDINVYLVKSFVVYVLLELTAMSSLLYLATEVTENSPRDGYFKALSEGALYMVLQGLLFILIGAVLGKFLGGVVEKLVQLIPKPGDGGVVDTVLCNVGDFLIDNMADLLLEFGARVVAMLKAYIGIFGSKGTGTPMGFSFLPHSVE